MDPWEWECVDSFVNDGGFSVTEASYLHAPVHSFSIKRDDKLQLILETRADQGAKSNAVDVLPGTVFELSDQVDIAAAELASQG